jgi:hypothetical protein
VNTTTVVQQDNAAARELIEAYRQYAGLQAEGNDRAGQLLEATNAARADANANAQLLAEGAQRGRLAAGNRAILGAGPGLLPDPVVDTAPAFDQALRAAGFRPDQATTSMEPGDGYDLMRVRVPVRKSGPVSDGQVAAAAAQAAKTLGAQVVGGYLLGDTLAEMLFVLNDG